MYYQHTRHICLLQNWKNTLFYLSLLLLLPNPPTFGQEISGEEENKQVTYPYSDESYEYNSFDIETAFQDFENLEALNETENTNNDSDLNSEDDFSDLQVQKGAKDYPVDLTVAGTLFTGALLQAKYYQHLRSQLENVDFLTEEINRLQGLSLMMRQGDAGKISGLTQDFDSLFQLKKQLEEFKDSFVQAFPAEDLKKVKLSRGMLKDYVSFLGPELVEEIKNKHGFDFANFRTSAPKASSRKAVEGLNQGVEIFLKEQAIKLAELEVDWRYRVDYTPQLNRSLRELGLPELSSADDLFKNFRYIGEHINKPGGAQHPSYQAMKQELDRLQTQIEVRQREFKVLKNPKIRSVVGGDPLPPWNRKLGGLRRHAKGVFPAVLIGSVGFWLSNNFSGLVRENQFEKSLEDFYDLKAEQASQRSRMLNRVLQVTDQVTPDFWMDYALSLVKRMQERGFEPFEELDADAVFVDHFESFYEMIPAIAEHVETQVFQGEEHWLWQAPEGGSGYQSFQLGFVFYLLAYLEKEKIISVQSVLEEEERSFNLDEALDFSNPYETDWIPVLQRRVNWLAAHVEEGLVLEIPSVKEVLWHSFFRKVEADGLEGVDPTLEQVQTIEPPPHSVLGQLKAEMDEEEYEIFYRSLSPEQRGWMMSYVLKWSERSMSASTVVATSLAGGMVAGMMGIEVVGATWRHLMFKHPSGNGFRLWALQKTQSKWLTPIRGMFETNLEAESIRRRIARANQMIVQKAPDFIEVSDKVLRKINQMPAYKTLDEVQELVADMEQLKESYIRNFKTIEGIKTQLLVDSSALDPLRHQPIEGALGGNLKISAVNKLEKMQMELQAIISQQESILDPNALEPNALDADAKKILQSKQQHLKNMHQHVVGTDIRSFKRFNFGSRGSGLGRRVLRNPRTLAFGAVAGVIFAVRSVADMFYDRKVKALVQGAREHLEMEDMLRDIAKQQAPYKVGVFNQAFQNALAAENIASKGPLLDWDESGALSETERFFVEELLFHAMLALKNNGQDYDRYIAETLLQYAEMKTVVDADGLFSPYFPELETLEKEKIEQLQAAIEAYLP